MILDWGVLLSNDCSPLKTGNLDTEMKDIVETSCDIRGRLKERICKPVVRIKYVKYLEQYLTYKEQLNKCCFFLCYYCDYY